MVDPTITAALIASATTAASTATSELSKELSSVGSGVGAVVTNKSVHSFDVYGYDDETEKFEKALEAKYTNLTVQQRSEFLTEYLALVGTAKDTVLRFDGKGENMGFESAVLLKSSGAHAGYNIQIVILIRKIPGGSYGVGIGSANKPDFYKTNDGEGAIDHIKKIHTNVCQYSDGGNAISVKLGNLTIKANAPGVVNQIDISGTIY